MAIKDQIEQYSLSFTFPVQIQKTPEEKAITYLEENHLNKTKLTGNPSYEPNLFSKRSYVS